VKDSVKDVTDVKDKSERQPKKNSDPRARSGGGIY
jgi:hypothetical protein